MLVPLTLWFIDSVISLEGTTRAGMVAWLQAPVPLMLILCLIIATFWQRRRGTVLTQDKKCIADPSAHPSVRGIQ